MKIWNFAMCKLKLKLKISNNERTMATQAMKNANAHYDDQEA